MRFLWLVLCAVALAHGGNTGDVLVLFASQDEKAVRIASLKLQLELEQNASLGERLADEGVGVATRQYGRFHALVVSPVRSSELRTKLKLTLGSRYNNMFFVAQVPGHPPRTSRGKDQPSKSPPLSMKAIDWVWLMILGLALTGLIASIIQRKKMFTFKKEQTRFKDNQTQMDQEIEILQGEKHE